MKNREQIEIEQNQIAHDGDQVKSEAQRMIEKGMALTLATNDILLDIRDLLIKLNKKK